MLVEEKPRSLLEQTSQAAQKKEKATTTNSSSQTKKGEGKGYTSGEKKKRGGEKRPTQERATRNWGKSPSFEKREEKQVGGGAVDGRANGAKPQSGTHRGQKKTDPGKSPRKKKTQAEGSLTKRRVPE